MSQSGLNMSRRIRRTPFTDCVEAHGVCGFSVVNHTLLPKAFGRSVEEDYWHLREHVQIWDVGCQRQVEIKGKDAARLVQMMTPRDLRKARVGQGLYVPLIDEDAGMLNDPVLQKLDDEHFWLSIADSDILLWAKGLAYGVRLDVEIDEPDVSPLAVQGPKANALMAGLFGDAIHDLPYFGFAMFDILGTRQLIARSGYSKQGGFEIYLQGGHLGVDLWNLIWEAGQAYDITPGCPNLIERIEGGLLSYGNEFTRANNPIECGFGSLCYLGDEVDYIGKTALKRIANSGAKQRISGIRFGGGKAPPCGKPFAVTAPDGLQVGQITSGIFSPRLNCNVGLSMIASTHWDIGTSLIVHTPDGMARDAVVCNLPFEDEVKHQSSQAKDTL
jgi:dimethylsulfoniopropionate demethylase